LDLNNETLRHVRALIDADDFGDVPIPSNVFVADFKLGHCFALQPPYRQVGA
jgi:hypothetical protein